MFRHFHNRDTLEHERYEKTNPKSPNFEITKQRNGFQFKLSITMSLT
jgi:hypothetical protein